MRFEEKFIAFIDILGFKSMAETSESGDGMSLSELMKNLSKLGTQVDEDKFQRDGLITCPESEFVDKSLNFKVTQISDCVIVSSEISSAGIINLINHCWKAVIELLMSGIMCRGYITKGSIYHQNNQVIGSGYQNAYAMESNVTAFKQESDERGTPFVEVDPIICNYINDSTDKCVKEMFSRMVKTKDDTTALFPFQQLSHSFAIGGFGQEFQPDKEKESNENIRKLLMSLKERVMIYVDSHNDKAIKKQNTISQRSINS